MLPEISSIIIQRNRRHLGISPHFPFCLIIPQSGQVFLFIPSFVLFWSLNIFLKKDAFE